MSADLSEVFRQGFKAIRDVSGGVYSSERGTSAMSVYVLNPISEIFAELDVTDEASVARAKEQIRKLCEAEHKVLSNYPAIMRFAFDTDPIASN